VSENDGLQSRYRVQRVDGRDRPGGDKAGARYFVLDYVHDPYARAALNAYADACEMGLPKLAADLRVELSNTLSSIDKPTGVVRDEGGAVVDYEWS